MQEIQSRERSDATNLQLAQEDNTSMKEAISQEGKERKIEQQKLDEMEKHINVVFQAILDSTESEEESSEEKIRKITQTMEKYKEHIKELEEHAIPTTPPELRAQREKYATTSTNNISGVMLNFTLPCTVICTISLVGVPSLVCASLSFCCCSVLIFNCSSAVFTSCIFSRIDTL